MHTATHLLTRAAAFTLLAGLWLSPALHAAPAAPAHTVLGIEGTRFTVNEKPTFLLGFSYYAALGAPEEFIQQDLDDLQRLGFNWLRVWATWDGYENNISAVDLKGNARQPLFDKLLRLVKTCDARGLVVDITLARRQSDQPQETSGLLPNAAAHEQAVETLVRGLKPYRNWYLDLANERDVGDARHVGPKELKHLRERVRQLDPDRLVTASFGGHDLSQDEVREAFDIGLDFLAPHRPRDPDSPKQTAPHTAATLATMKAVGKSVPIQYQEPFRRGYTRWEPTAQDFLTDLHGAQTGGAAGWCFHNGSQRTTRDEQPRRSFDLRAKRLLAQLDSEELHFVRNAAAPGTEAENTRTTPR